MIPIRKRKKKLIPSDTSEQLMQWSERVTTSLPFSFAYSNRTSILICLFKPNQSTLEGTEREYTRDEAQNVDGRMPYSPLIGRCHDNWWLRRLPSYWIWYSPIILRNRSGILLLTKQSSIFFLLCLRHIINELQRQVDLNAQYKKWVFRQRRQ